MSNVNSRLNALLMSIAVVLSIGIAIYAGSVVNVCRLKFCESTTVDGTVVNTEEVNPKRPRFMISYEFTPVDGSQKVEDLDAVSFDMYRGTQIGDLLKVVYLNSNPSVCALRSGTSYTSSVLYHVAGVLVLVLITVIVLLGATRRGQRFIDKYSYRKCVIDQESES